MANGIGIACIIAAMVILVVGLVAIFVYDSDDWMFPALMVALVLMVIGFASWGIGELNDPHKGVITEKIFKPRHLVCSKGCYHVDDKWYFMLDDNGNVGDREVSHSTYDRLSVGQFYEG